MAEPANTTPQAGRDLGPLPALDRPRRQKLLTWCVLSAVWVLSGAYAAHYCTRGWIPNDDGTLAQSALRVLEGQLPHRDFVDPYTGGLSYFHAGAFQAFGINLVSLRVAVFIIFLLWVPAVFYVASRFLSPISAGGVTLLAVVWGYPNYPAAMPSWYNLFLAVFGIAALLRYLEVGTSRWLFLAGICGGLSFLVKVIGLYYVAAVLLFLVYREQNLAACARKQVVPAARAYCWFVMFSLLAFLTSVVALIHGRLGSGEVFHFVLPSAVLVAVLIWRELRTGACEGRFTRLTAMVVPFLSGFMLPIGVFLVPYIRSGALRQFFDGVFLRAISGAAGMGILRPAGITTAILAVPMLCMLLVAVSAGGAGPAATTAFFASLAVALLASARYASVARLVWFSIYMFAPIIVFAGAAILLGKSKLADNLSNTRQQQLMLVLSMAAVCSLVQFPLAAPIYFCYCAPLSVLALAAVLSAQKERPTRYMVASLLGFCILYAVTRVGPSLIYATFDVGSRPKIRALELPRAAGIRVSVDKADLYERIIPIIQEHASGKVIVAAPECSELYFLAGLHNPTSNDSDARLEDVLHAIRTGQLREVVINSKPVFAGYVAPAEVDAELRDRLPHSTTVGQFLIRWRP